MLLVFQLVLAFMLGVAVPLLVAWLLWRGYTRNDAARCTLVGSMLLGFQATSSHKTVVIKGPPGREGDLRWVPLRLVAESIIDQQTVSLCEVAPSSGDGDDGDDDPDGGEAMPRAA